MSTLKDSHEPNNKLLAQCAVAFPSNLYVKPGETSFIVHRASDVWRPFGLRLGFNADSLVVEDIIINLKSQLTNPMDGLCFDPYLSYEHYNMLLSGGVRGIIIDIPYTKYNAKPISMPKMRLLLSTVGLNHEMRIGIRNSSTTPQFVSGAIFFDKYVDNITSNNS
jgi:hypothetical protein